MFPSASSTSVSRWLAVALLILLVAPGVVRAANNPVPVLNPIVPAATAPGTQNFTLVVTGTGFVTGAVVRFNGSNRATTFINSSKLTAVLTNTDLGTPNTATITVSNPGPGGGLSNIQYFETTTFISQLYFTEMSVTGKNNLTSNVVGGDFNLDGKADIAVASGNRVFTLAGNNDGTFGTPKPTNGPTNGNITGLRVVPSFTVNGVTYVRPTIIATGSKGTSTSFVAVMISAADGTFYPPIETDFNFSIPASAVVGDFNGDGIVDLAFTTASSVQILFGNPDGTFSQGPTTALTQVGRDTVAVGDFNGDGKLDLVITVYDPNSNGFNYTGVLLGRGDGTFGPLSAVAGSGTSFAGAITAVVGDFNNDGKLDVATAIQSIGQLNQGYILISLGKGDGTFSDYIDVPNVNSITTPLLIGDFNGDGNLDLATGQSIYFGHGDGTFPSYTRSSTAPTLVAALDVNGDGLPDLLDETAYISGNQVLLSIGLELQTPPQPDFKGVVAPFNPTVTPGGTITIPVTLEALNGWTDDVVISATNLPNGIKPSYNPVLVNGGNGSCTITLTASPSTHLGQYNIILSGNSGSLTHSTTATITVQASAGDFTGSVLQAAGNTQPGGAVTYQVSIQPLYGFTGSVILDVAGLPAGTTASFNPDIVTGGNGTSTLTLQTTGSTPVPSISNVTVTGTNGNLSHSTPVYLGVSSTSGDFNGAVSPSLQSVSSASGGTATYGISLTPVNGGAGDVTLTVAGLPGNSVSSFSPAVIVGGSGTSQLVVQVPSGTATGTYSLMISSSGSGVIHVSNVTLSVNP